MTDTKRMMIGPVQMPAGDNRRRVIGPEMPPCGLPPKAAVIVDEDPDEFIGPPPPLVIAEAESANEAECFEEVTRIVAADAGSAYDVMGINYKMAFDKIKKRYSMLSLMVHPDKCSHPQSCQAFVLLNKAFKELKDPVKRRSVEDAMRKKEEKEELMAELKVVREAAQWRRSQGISMKGDDELLAAFEVPVTRGRDDWMTSLPPRRRQGIVPQSRHFSRTGWEEKIKCHSDKRWPATTTTTAATESSLEKHQSGLHCNVEAKAQVGLHCNVPFLIL